MVFSFSLQPSAFSLQPKYLPPGLCHGILECLGRAADHRVADTEGQPEVSWGTEASTGNGQDLFFLEDGTELHIILYG